MKINFPQDMKESGTGGGPLPLGEYPCQLHLKVWQTDNQGTIALGPDRKPVPNKTRAGDMLWYVEAAVISGPHAGKTIHDNWSFGPAIARVHAVLVRLGLIPEGYRGDFDINPEEIEGTFWWVTVDEHQVSERNGAPAPSKFPFKNNGCACAVCAAQIGKMVFVNARVGFAGYRPMSPAEVKAARAAAPPSQPGGAGAPPF